MKRENRHYETAEVLLEKIERRKERGTDVILPRENTIPALLVIFFPDKTQK
ncbi:MAG TPA: hypothetical protein HA306_05720 [Methanosarcina sp.]|nr:hypothetical protein [Methanosarcina sp.]